MSGTEVSLIAWYVARVAAMTAFAVLGLAIFTGTAIRTGYLQSLASNRAVIAFHQFLSWLWIPLVVVHITALLLDGAAQVHLLDLVIPFQVHYTATSALAIGLGTVGFLLLVLTSVAALCRRWLGQAWWRWVHRLTYPTFVVFLLHAQFAGTDFSHFAVSLAGWALLGLVVVLAIPRLSGGRLEASPDSERPRGMTNP